MNADEDTSRRQAPTPKGLAFLGAVAGGLVHEIRNPLSTMNVTLQLLQEDWPREEDEPDPKAKRTARRIANLSREVSRLGEILDDFLRYAGIRRLNLSKADVNRVLEEVVAFIAPECARAETEILFYPDRSLPLIVLDERLLKQAILNLLLNGVQALESMPLEPAAPEPAALESGTAEPPRRRRELIVRTRGRGDEVLIDVIDTGPGIPEAIRERVWEVYFSRRRSGSGLGLPRARRVAEEHGGSLAFETAMGKGTNFTLRLPVHGPAGDGTGPGKP